MQSPFKDISSKHQRQMLMTILKNARHERFAIGLADGLSQEKSYIEAGFSQKGARGSASTLLKQYSYILKRRDEILSEREKMHSISSAQAMKTLQITKEDVMKELLDNAMKAKAAIPVIKNGVPTGMYNANISASNQALIALGKEIGMFADKKEEPRSEYANMSTEELIKYTADKCRKLGFTLLPVSSEAKKIWTKIK